MGPPPLGTRWKYAEAPVSVVGWFILTVIVVKWALLIWAMRLIDKDNA